MLKFTEEADLQAAIARGDFVESHYCEAKEVLKSASSSNNKELARDLAQFAIDGGVLVYGVAEDTTKHTFQMAPFQIPAGALERIEQIAATACQPPLPVEPRIIASERSPGAGYVVVDVPVSPRAPHMVDGRYLARGETQKRYLDDASLRAILANRATDLERVEALLDQLVVSDPLRDAPDRNAHFFAAAIPLSAAPGNDADRELLQDVYLGARLTVRDEHMLSSWPRTIRTRLTGCVMVSDTLLGGEQSANTLARTDQQAAVLNQSAEFGVRHDGGIWAYHSRASKRDDHRRALLFPAQVGRSTALVVAAAAKWSAVHEYHGSWALGIAVTGMTGARPVERELWDTAPLLTDEAYRRFTRSTTAELATDGDSVTTQLTARFLAMCGR